MALLSRSLVLLEDLLVEEFVMVLVDFKRTSGFNTLQFNFFSRLFFSLTALYISASAISKLL